MRTITLGPNFFWGGGSEEITKNWKPSHSSVEGRQNKQVNPHYGTPWSSLKRTR